MAGGLVLPSGAGSPAARDEEGEPVPPRRLGRGRFPMEMSEDDLVGKQGRPFKGGCPVGIGSADQFMLAVGKPDEFSLPELTDQAVAGALDKIDFQFHTRPLYRRG